MDWLNWCCKCCSPSICLSEGFEEWKKKKKKKNFRLKKEFKKKKKKKKKKNSKWD